MAKDVYSTREMEEAFYICTTDATCEGCALYDEDGPCDMRMQDYTVAYVIKDCGGTQEEQKAEFLRIANEWDLIDPLIDAIQAVQEEENERSVKK